MNAFFTNSFYSYFPTNILFLIVIGISILLTFLATLKNGMVFNVFSWAMLFLVILFAYIQIVGGTIFPVVTLQVNIFVCYLVLLVIIQYTASKEQSFIKSAFSRYLSPTVVDRLIENREGLTLGGEERELTIFFSDIAGFTTISEKTNPQQLVKLLNEYFTEMTTIITNNGGMIDKYIGDAIMAEFGAPLYFEGHSLAATRAALQMQKKCDDLNKIWKQRGDPEIRARVGLNSGNVILGNMGSHQVFDYTVIGDSVNLASRLESAGKKYGCNILISESVYNGIEGSGIQTRLLDYIKVKGKTKPVKVYEVMEDEYYEKYREYFLRFQEALDEYYNRNFTKADELFPFALT
ncbi:MAG: adenylate/guanylate cyclase domain-containing protein [Ignavibacteriales bacterium]|nr:adenylate/guanylate cyclase domain-containing protein [Ignavibacteriales bacterium]